MHLADNTYNQQRIVCPKTIYRSSEQAAHCVIPFPNILWDALRLLSAFYNLIIAWNAVYVNEFCEYHL